MLRILLATAALSVLPFAAGAADLAVKAPVVYDNWGGFYFGGTVGVARHDATWNEIDNGGGCITDGCSGSFTLAKTGATFGALAGYNFQHRNFVYGIETDFSWLDTDASQEWRPGRNHSAFQNSVVNGLVTVRGRAGIAIDSTLLYLTAGIASANVKDSISLTFPTVSLATNCSGNNNNNGNNSCNSWRIGWVAGGGVEHMFNPHWTARAEVLYVDLGNSTANGTWRGIKTEGFSDTLVMARGGVAFKWN